MRLWGGGESFKGRSEGVAFYFAYAIIELLLRGYVPFYVSLFVYYGFRAIIETLVVRLNQSMRIMDKNEYALTGADSRESDSFVRISGKMLARVIGLAWRLQDDRQAIAALIGRYSAHASLIALAVLIGLLGYGGLAQDTLATAADPSDRVAADEVSTPTPSSSETSLWQASSGDLAIYRQAIPHTELPERQRLEVITYTIQTGDTVYGIAEAFKINPSTIVWGNREALRDAPWMIQPGLPIYILPVDGVYHTVAEGETPEGIAEQYKVEVSALYNDWNAIRPEETLRAGALLVIPGGEGSEIEWTAPPPKATVSGPGVASASYSSGYCNNVAVSGPGANGSFVLPTGSYRVSGWIFHDPGNPTHIGLDYGCRLGEPIYAADNGVVIHSGWGGGYGNLIRIDHGNGYVTYYAHLSEIYYGCGDSVYQGQLIGLCGSTGYSTGPHLHYEIRYQGVPQNPILYEP